MTNTISNVLVLAFWGLSPSDLAAIGILGEAGGQGSKDSLAEFGLGTSRCFMDDCKGACVASWTVDQSSLDEQNDKDNHIVLRCRRMALW